MADIASVAAGNLLSPMVLFFALGFLAATARSDLQVPEAVAKALALYLMMGIGFKGGVELSRYGADSTLLAAIAAGAVLSGLLPILAFALLKVLTRLSRTDSAAVAAHYGSISVVTFVAGSEFLSLLGVRYEGYMVAVMAVMETPAIVTGLLLARTGMGPPSVAPSLGLGRGRQLFREIFLNGSVVILVGAFAIGAVTGEPGMTAVGPFLDEPFRGVLCLFLLDMGLVAAARFRSVTTLSGGAVAFAILMPLIGASIGVATGGLIGLGVGEAALLGILCGSASYIAVPAAMRLALPEASPAIYLTLSLAITFPFNLSVGIPLYYAMANTLIGG